MRPDPAVERVRAQAYTIPTDFPKPTARRPGNRRRSSSCMPRRRTCAASATLTPMRRSSALIDGKLADAR